MAIPYSRFVVGSITWYSVLIMAGILLAYVLGAREEKRLGLPKDTMLDVVLVTVPAGIIGSRVYYVLMKLDEFAADPVSVLYIWKGGVAIYGAVIGGVLALWILSRVKKISFASLTDLVAPGLILAQAIGRWGNYFNREAFGPVITDKFWQFFPAGVLIAEGGAEVWHAATFFYESMWNLAVFCVLWFTRKRMKRRGDVFLWYLALYGCGRYLIEQLRTDSLYLLGMRVSQMLSLLIVRRCCGGVSHAAVSHNAADGVFRPRAALRARFRAAAACVRPARRNRCDDRAVRGVPGRAASAIPAATGPPCSLRAQIS